MKKRYLLQAGVAGVVLISGIALISGVIRLGVTDGSIATAAFPDPATDTLPIESLAVAALEEPKAQIAVFAGGCFLGMEGVFEHLKGVSEVFTGYAGAVQSPRTMRR